MPPFIGKKSKDAAPKEPKAPKLTKQEKKLAAEKERAAALMRAEGIDMPEPAAAAAGALAEGDATPKGDASRKSGSLMPSVSYSANKARQKQGEVKKVKLSFKDRMTDKVASGAVPLTFSLHFRLPFARFPRNFPPVLAGVLLTTFLLRDAGHDRQGPEQGPGRLHRGHQR